MAAPQYVRSGTGVVITTGSAAVSITATIGNFLILHLFNDGNGGQNGVTPLTNCCALDGRTTDLDRPMTFCDVNGVAAHYILLGRATGTAVSCTLAVNVAGNDCYARWHEFSGVARGRANEECIENGGATPPALFLSSTGLSTGITDAAVTTNGPDRLALNFIAVDDDNQADFDTEAFTGMTGGTWVNRGSYGSATGTDGSIGLQSCEMLNAGTIDGGSLTMALADNWGTAGFALKPPASVPASMDRYTPKRRMIQRR